MQRNVRTGNEQRLYHESIIKSCKCRIIISPNFAARGLGQHIDLRQSDGSGLDVIDAQIQEYVMSSPGREMCI